MSNEVRLRDVAPDDPPIFYEQQLDADATRMAAFPARQVAGNIGSWSQDGARLACYSAFLHLVTDRPLHELVFVLR